MDIQVKWTSGLEFEAHAAEDRTLLLASSMEEIDDSRATPMELLLIAVAGCTAMDVISILQKKRQDVENFEVHASGQRAEEHPRVYTHIDVEYRIFGSQIDAEAVERAIELSITKYCSVQAMLQPAVNIDHTYSITETDKVLNRES